MEDYDEGIIISEQIIELAKKIKDNALEKEQEDYINNLREKIRLKASGENIEEETLTIKNMFDELIKTNKFDDVIEAHKIVVEFKKKYDKVIDLTNIPSTNELLAREENLWFNFTRDQQSFIKELEKLENQIEKSIEKKEVSRSNEIMIKAKDLLIRISDDEDIKKKWIEIENNYLAWKRKNVTIVTIENSIEESSKLKKNFQFEEAISKIDITMELIEDKEIIEYSKKLREIRNEIVATEEGYIKIREKIAVLDEKIKENRKNKHLNAALINCEKLIQIAENIKKPDVLLKYNQILEEIKEELDKIKANIHNEQLELIKKASDLEEIIEVDNKNVLPLVEEFSVNDILGDLSDDANEMLNQLGNLLIEHRVEVKKEITNRTLLKSVSGEVVELEKNLEVQKIGEMNEMVKSSITNPFEDAIEEAVITDLIPYNFEITDMQLNGKPVKELPDKSLTKEGLELKWQIQNIPPEESVEINYDLRRRVSRTIIFVLKGQLKIIKTHSNLNKLELDGLYEARLPFSNSYGSVLDGVIVEDIIPLYYLHFIKEPTHLLPAKASSEYGELVKWNVGSMEAETLNYQYRLLELYRLEELKINIIDLSNNGINALFSGDLTEALTIYDNIINQLEDYNK